MFLQNQNFKDKNSSLEVNEQLLKRYKNQFLFILEKLLTKFMKLFPHTLLEEWFYIGLMEASSNSQKPWIWDFLSHLDPYWFMQKINKFCYQKQKLIESS